ncbi:PH domain-containing protein [Candidatus Saccharibacteria bacterium]|nr:PH domain-containing protein [Candidatus Saccharibacteria bacterium]
MDENLAKIRHERSKRDFPHVNFQEDEYVEFAFSRAKVCLWAILGATFGGLILILLAFLLVLLGQNRLDEMGRHFLFVILFALLAAAVVIGIIALKIYNGNKLFITNKRAIQLVVNTLVSSSVNVIDLSSIEDASFRQDTILQRIFSYGTLRLATVGDETTYTFKYSDITSEQLKAVSKLISVAKKTMRKDK